MKDLSPRKSDLDPIEIASTDEIRALQLERLKWSLHHAYDNVAMFRKRFDEKGVHPDDLKTLEDLAKFPFAYKNDLRDNYPFGLFAVPREQIIRIHASSGTTGKPTVVGYTKDDIDNWAPPGCAAEISCTTPMATAFLPAAWGRITGSSGSALPWCQWAAAKPKNRSA